jgi:hypothetical protein
VPGTAPPFQVEAVPASVRRAVAWVGSAVAAGVAVVAAMLAWRAGSPVASAWLALAAAVALIPPAAAQRGTVPGALRWTGAGWQVNVQAPGVASRDTSWQPVEAVGIVLALPSAVLLRVRWTSDGARRRDDLLPLVQSRTGALHWRLLHSTLRHGRVPPAVEP